MPGVGRHSAACKQPTARVKWEQASPWPAWALQPQPDATQAFLLLCWLSPAGTDTLKLVDLKHKPEGDKVFEVLERVSDADFSPLYFTNDLMAKSMAGQEVRGRRTCSVTEDQHRQHTLGPPPRRQGRQVQFASGCSHSCDSSTDGPPFCCT